MTFKSIVLISLNIENEQEAAFNDFYHHTYIPNIMLTIPELKTVRRYKEYNVDHTLRYYTKNFLTLYECESEETAQIALDAINQRAGREKEKAAWKNWETNYMHNLQHARIYHLRYEHSRKPWDGSFGSRPFFMVSVEINANQQHEFNDWYEKIYLPTNLADVPSWAACRRYTSEENGKVRQHTIYEAWDEPGLHHCLELMRGPHRMKENASWKKWDSGPQPVITWEDASSYTQIFRYPD